LKSREDRQHRRNSVGRSGERRAPGGAPFNFAVQARRLGHDVVFVSAVGEDERGLRALAEIETLGLSAAFVQRVAQSTGTVTVHFDPSGEPQYTIHRPAAYDFLNPDPERVAAFHPDWMYFGTLLQMNRHARGVTRQVLESASPAHRFYDVNLRPDSYTPALVNELMHQADAVKLNEQEMTELAPRYPTIERFCRDSARKYDWQAVCVTRGERGCALLVGDDYAESKDNESRCSTPWEPAMPSRLHFCTVSVKNGPLSGSEISRIESVRRPVTRRGAL